MKKMFLLTSVAILIFGITGESWAEVISCTNGKYANGTECEACGDGCDWSFDTTSGKLTVTGSGTMNDYDHYKKEDDGPTYSTAPWGNYRTQVKSVDVSGVSNVGAYAFCHLNVSDIKLGDSIKTIGSAAFAWNNSSINNLVLPDSLETLGYIAFRTIAINSITIPATLKKIGKGALGINKDSIKNMDIICLGTKEECNNLKTKLNNYSHLGKTSEVEYIDISGNVKLAGYAECKSTNYFWNGAECVREPDKSKRKCCASCKDMGGWCNRIRYTPAEAAEVLRDDNTNVVTITFKK